MVLWKLWGWFSLNTKWWQTLMDHLWYTLQWSRPKIVTLKGLGLIKPWYQRSYFLCFWICRCHRMSFFKLTMKSNVASSIHYESYDFWKSLTFSQVIAHKLPTYLKLVKIVMVQVIGFVEDERCFGNLNFIKSTLYN